MEITAREAAGGGSRVHVQWNRTGIGLTGNALTALVVLSRGSILRQKVFQVAFDRAIRSLPMVDPQVYSL